MAKVVGLILLSLFTISQLFLIPPGDITELKAKWQPHFYLSFCGKRAVTADCVKKVDQLIQSNPELAQDLDLKMRQSFAGAKLALEDSGDIEALKKAIDIAADCFAGWSLLSNDLKEHMSLLKQKGALAVKPTGSGDGGFVLSLWEKPVEADQFPWEMIACNNNK